MRLLILCLFISLSLVYSANSTIKKISTNKKSLSLVQKQQQKTTRKLDKIAKDIKAAEEEIVYLDKKIVELEKDQYKIEKAYTHLRKTLRGSQSKLERINKEFEHKQKQFTKLLSEQFSVNFAMEKAYELTRSSIIHQEIYQIYKRRNTQILAQLKEELDRLKYKKNNAKSHRNHIKNQLEKIIKKRESYTKKKKKKEKLHKKLILDEEKYTARLQKIADKQNALRTTLAKLNILRKQEVQEARRRAAIRKEILRKEKERKRKLRLAKMKIVEKERKFKEALKHAKTKIDRKRVRLMAEAAATAKMNIIQESQRVRNINSSYKKEIIYHYHGKKTISPITGAKLIKKFGTYIDPIYKIKIFNESITLKAPSSPGKVKNILNGKIVFAGESSMLGKVVVVRHRGKIHTVYAGLSKIAPTIRVGKKIKKGYVIGKVKHKLLFQATKNSKHINPLKLIRV
ncbi:MAG: peptidoglycan DD-metalloendopeptidase family protein [Sulfurovum sp.]|nr:peptidoglycan DD-metalloendopeptidase family protein [Sulfurovum sp.]